MELVAMDMKMRGRYIARQLSFAGVSFRIREVPMDDMYKSKVYDQSVKLWVAARDTFQEACRVHNTCGQIQMDIFLQDSLLAF